MGIDIAVAIFENEVHEAGAMNLSSKSSVRSKSYAGYYQGAAAALMSIFAYYAYVMYKKQENDNYVKTVKTSDTET